MFNNFVQFLVQSLYMTSLKTYPKFSSIDFPNFELQQKRCRTEFEFSIKIYKFKLWSCFVEVVDLLSLRLTKLGLYFFEFSVNSYAFSNVLDQHANKLR
jgi:hypothetical protein